MCVVSDSNHERDWCFTHFALDLDLIVLGPLAAYADLGSGSLEDGLHVLPSHADEDGDQVEEWVAFVEKDVHPDPRWCTWPPLLCCGGQSVCIGIVIGISGTSAIMVISVWESAACGKAAGPPEPMLAEVCHACRGLIEQA